MPSCGVETQKPLWVRERSCPSCEFELDRDWNAALNVLSRGRDKLEVVHSEATPVETATAVSPDGATIRPSSWMQVAFVEGASTGCQTQSDNAVKEGSSARKKTASAAE